MGNVVEVPITFDGVTIPRLPFHGPFTFRYSIGLVEIRYMATFLDFENLTISITVGEKSVKLPMEPNMYNSRYFEEGTDSAQLPTTPV